MRLYYTGVNKQTQSQLNPFQSLGGYISSTLVPSGRLNNIFDNVQSKQEQQLRGLGLYNDKDETIPLLDIYIEAEFQIETEMEIAIVVLGSDDCGYYMERIQNGNDLPYAGVFNNVLGVDNKITIPDVQPLSYYGLWIKRKVLDNIGCDELYELYKTQQEVEDEVFNITFIERES